jgi:hypothetical protein
MDINLNLDPAPGHFEEPPPAPTVKLAPAAPTPAPRGEYYCEICQRNFTNQFALDQHNEHKHAPQAAPAAAPEPQPETPHKRLTIKVGKGYNYLCLYCDYNSSRPSVERHMAKEHPGQPGYPPINKGINPHKNGNHHTKPAPKTRKTRASEETCPLCSRPFNSRHGLAVHYNCAHPKKTLRVETDPFECTKCGMTFLHKVTGNLHALKVHGTSRDGVIAPRKPGTAAKTLDVAAPVRPQPLNRSAFALTHYAQSQGINGNIRVEGNIEQVLANCRMMLQLGADLIELGQITT